MATNGTAEPQGQCEVRTTAYTHSRYGMERNANDSQLKAGDLQSAAADWSPFPLGTNTINIIEPGSYARSLALLKPRKRVSYLRRMVKVLEQQV
jgi:hypothetical protein